MRPTTPTFHNVGVEFVHLAITPICPIWPLCHLAIWPLLLHRSNGHMNKFYNFILKRRSSGTHPFNHTFLHFKGRAFHKKCFQIRCMFLFFAFIQFLCKLKIFPIEGQGRCLALLVIVDVMYPPKSFILMIWKLENCE